MAIEAGVGMKYGFQAQFTIAANPSAQLDILTILAASNIPIAIQRLVITSNQSNAQTVPITVAVLSAAGSGGTSTGTSSVPEPPSGAAASETLTVNNTTPGTVVKTEAAAWWQIFNAYEFQRKPGALLITPGQAFALRCPTNGGVPTGGIVCAIEGEYIAFK